MNAVAVGPALAVLLVVLAGLAAGLSWWARVGQPRDILIAAGRAVVQLAVVSLVIGVVLRSLWLTAGFVLLMSAVAAATSARRITGSPRRAAVVGLSILGGVTPVLLAVLVSGVVPARPVAVLPVAGILVGGAMTATSLSGRRLAEELTVHRGQYEALLAVGFLRRDAVRILGRPVAALALIPGLDQTRTVGLVTLPGAFVGVLLAGASPWQAGAAQVLVLVGLLLGQICAVSITVELVAAGWLPPGPQPLPE